MAIGFANGYPVMTNSPNSLAHLLDGEGETIPCFEGELHRAEAYAIWHFSGRPYCPVREWVIVDVTHSTNLRNDSMTPDQRPRVLYAADVVLDCTRRHRPGDWLLSTFEQPSAIHHLFRTKDTTYLLMGRGRITVANADTGMAIIDLLNEASAVST